MMKQAVICKNSGNLLLMTSETAKIKKETKQWRAALFSTPATKFTATTTPAREWRGGILEGGRVFADKTCRF
ncbi:unnamed protein product [Meloidogyne enterolobii]|uniref:Uncharacterized protein n=1 Tax=Meloidogyne enterolobii TaxID=390850 RepID=A0ACB1ANQ3_MELEN